MIIGMSERPGSAGGTTIVQKPSVFVGPSVGEQLADMFQVVLWNDDHTEAGFVVRCLMQVFRHPFALATKIMFEAHNNGKAIAEVEGKETATLHAQQLQSFGLTVSMEKI